LPQLDCDSLSVLYQQEYKFHVLTALIALGFQDVVDTLDEFRALLDPESEEHPCFVHIPELVLFWSGSSAPPYCVIVLAIVNIYLRFNTINAHLTKR
jgi:hypothetical protein